jgi:hypothetical protein
MGRGRRSGEQRNQATSSHELKKKRRSRTGKRINSRNSSQGPGTRRSGHELKKKGRSRTGTRCSLDPRGRGGNSSLAASEYGWKLVAGAASLRGGGGGVRLRVGGRTGGGWSPAGVGHGRCAAAWGRRRRLREPARGRQRRLRRVGTRE